MGIDRLASSAELAATTDATPSPPLSSSTMNLTTPLSIPKRSICSSYLSRLLFNFRSTYACRALPFHGCPLHCSRAQCDQLGLTSHGCCCSVLCGVVVGLLDCFLICSVFPSLCHPLQQRYSRTLFLPLRAALSASIADHQEARLEQRRDVPHSQCIPGIINTVDNSIGSSSSRRSGWTAVIRRQTCAHYQRAMVEV